MRPRSFASCSSRIESSWCRLEASVCVGLCRHVCIACIWHLCLPERAPIAPHQRRQKLEFACTMRRLLWDSALPCGLANLLLHHGALAARGPGLRAHAAGHCAPRLKSQSGKGLKMSTSSRLRTRLAATVPKVASSRPVQRKGQFVCCILLTMLLIIYYVCMYVCMHACMYARVYLYATSIPRACVNDACLTLSLSQFSAWSAAEGGVMAYDLGPPRLPQC